MSLSNEQLYEALVEGGGVTREQFMKAVGTRSAKKFGVDGVLISEGLLTETQVGQLIADWYGVRHLDLTIEEPQDNAIALIPESFARNKLVIPVEQTADIVTVTSSDPKDVVLHALLEKYLRREVKIVYSTPREIKANLHLFQKDPGTAFTNIIEAGKRAITSEDESSEGNAAESVTIELVNAFFDYAYQARASDVHIEPEEEYVVIRFRVDGILQDVGEIEKEYHDAIISRLKVLAKLATDEHRAAQDGRITHKNRYGDKIDVRLSIVPTTTGEKAVMRLLAEKTRQFSLKDLGMTNSNLKQFREAIKKPWGMILVTGPTGSGKTTTLYAALKVLNRREVNIATIEDPVEYDIDGISQIQVNPKTNLTFAKGLRSIVRQDPDIIMVGEVRDGETADIAVNAAMTGHLVLSTLHTNDAATSFPRLKDMGVEDFLVSSTVVVVIAQRLVRTICLHCIRTVELTPQEIAVINHNPQVKKYLSELLKKKTFKNTRVFRGRGCKVCNMTGYHGRTGIYEVLIVSDALRAAVLANKDADELKAIAVKGGMKTMLYDGIEKITTGITTLEEVLRVTQE